MSERDLLKAIAEAECAKTALQAEIAKESTPFMVPLLAAWVSMTCPNHPQPYTKEELEAHNAKVGK